MFKFHKLFPALLIAFCVLVMPCMASAFAVAPAIVEVSVDPGKVTKGIITVKNDEPTDQTFYLSFQKFIAQGENGQQSFLPPTDVSGLPSWLSVDTPSFMLAPGQVKLVNYAIAPPKNTKAGGYYAAIFVANRAPAQHQSQNVTMGARTGVLLFVTVTGQQVKQEGLVENWKRTQDQQVHWSIQIKNTGTIHLAPTGTLLITNLFGQTVATLPFNPEHSRILPQTSRTFEVNWDPKSDSLAFLNEGPLTATLSIDVLHFEDRKTWWRFPLKTLTIILMIALVIFLKQKTKKPSNKENE